ncbi:MAG: glycerate 2-kinase [Cellvibrionaceae bacterium]|jgi:glycerate 2-kinase
MNPKLKFENHKSHLFEMINAAVAAVDPYKSTQKLLKLDKNRLSIGDQEFDLNAGRLLIVAIGKAAVPMANGVVDQLGRWVDSGVAVTKKGQTQKVSHPAVQTLFAAHPVPDESSIKAADLIIELLEQTAEGDLVLFLISGGASALCTRPLLEMEDWQALSQALLASGCSIQEFNTVRKQLDGVKGGGLGQMVSGANMMTLVLSDVIGNPIDMIGSGPTVPNSQIPADALAILEKYEIDSPVAVKKLKETPHSQHDFDSPFEFVGDLKIACQAAKEAATKLGLHAKILTTKLDGEAREVGALAAGIAKELEPGVCVIMGGETTVTLTGTGIGGRNQELALAAAIDLAGVADVVIATYATDGDDGPTNAAGAIVTGETVKSGLGLGLRAADYLARNDSFTYFEQVEEHLIITGQTGTNVNDLLFIIRYGRV